MRKPGHLVLIDVDGLRRDVFRAALTAGDLPNVERIVGGREGETACHVDALSTAPSITFAAQASIFTGQHPGRHGIAGNESFDRLGRISSGRPRHFGFDVGYTLAVDDAVRVFSDGLASQLLNRETPTLYEIASANDMTSAVAYNMYARGADAWLPPDVVEIARFTKGKGVLGLEASQYDGGMLDCLIAHLDAGNRPDLLTAYFMGLDHHSHVHGPTSQPAYLRDVIDPQIGRLLDALAARGMLAGALFALVSDHGQIEVVPDDRHSIRLGFPFDRELGHLFESLGLDVHDLPGEDPACDAVMGLNGGLAHVYLQHRAARWAAPPRHAEDVLPVAESFRQMNESGKYEESLRNSLDLILVRDAEREGWQGEYRVYLGNGETQPFADYLALHPELGYADPVNRIRLAASPMTGDLILVADGRAGYYFGGPTTGVHGGLLPEESEVVLTFALPGGSSGEIVWLRETVAGVVAGRCVGEGNRQPSLADLTPAALALLGLSRRQFD
ncbi:MAG: alkaline phosphatase family protein [Chloroflexi bacterium]|nr:alkaline phosphatase family protein [Chloroflexota bacterium]